MLTRKDLAREALAAALEIRKTKENFQNPICIYDLAEELKIEVRFADIPSLEGMYSSTPRPAIIIGSERPAGRRVYTCGHELGHHVFGHGTRVDELRSEGSGASGFEPEEFLAQTFAGFLLMPKLAVCNAFKVRGWKPALASPEQIYRVSNLFGVTYAALIQHMSMMELLPRQQAEKLLNVKLKEIRSTLISDPRRQLILVDHFWKGRAIDLEVGDLILTPSAAISEGSCLIKVEQTKNGGLYEAAQAGRGRLFDSAADWAALSVLAANFMSGAVSIDTLKRKQMNSPVESKNLSVAWAKAFLTLMQPGCSEIKPLIVSVDGIDEGEAEENDEIRRALDEALAGHKTSCNTVANTIFPESLWNPARERALLYQRYLVHTWPRVKKCPANHRGTYFQRLIAFENGDAPINQLEHVITTWHKKNHRHSALQLSVFDPRHDHTDGRRLGFPCLHQVCFTPLGANGSEGLAVTGFYATQHFFEKAYGNYLGLCRLGKFMAHEMNLRFTRMTCIAACAKLGDVNKTELEPLASKLRMIPGDEGMEINGESKLKD